MSSESWAFKVDDFIFPSFSTLNDFVFRNIATCNPSQNLFDDIAQPQDYENLFELEESSNPIHKKINQKSRPLEYGSFCSLFLKPLTPPWGQGRFGDGHNYGVIYTALEEKTSIKEVFFYLQKDALRMFPHTSGTFIQYDRSMLKAKIESKKVYNLCSLAKKYPELVHKESYDFCQKIGVQARKKEAEALMSFSVRNEGGICVPIFTANCIKKDKKIFYLSFVFYKSGRYEIQKSKEIQSGVFK